MSEKLPEIIKRIKERECLKNEGDVAFLLHLTSGALSNHKKRGTLPLEALLTYCEKENISFDWLLTGEKKPEKDNLTVNGRQVIYNVSGDADLSEILKWLKDNPNDKKLVLKLIKGRKYTKEALEGFNIQNTLNEEGT